MINGNSGTDWQEVNLIRGQWDLKVRPPESAAPLALLFPASVPSHVPTKISKVPEFVKSFLPFPFPGMAAAPLNPMVPARSGF